MDTSGDSGGRGEGGESWPILLFSSWSYLSSWHNVILSLPVILVDRYPKAHNSTVHVQPCLHVPLSSHSSARRGRGRRSDLFRNIYGSCTPLGNRQGNGFPGQVPLRQPRKMVFCHSVFGETGHEEPVSQFFTLQFMEPSD